jgi:hypothetical protein
VKFPRCDADFDVSQGRHVEQVDGNENLKWEVSGASGKAVIALSYIFVGVYGATWVRIS